MAKQTFTTGQVLTAAQMTSLQQTAMGGGSPVTKTASYVLTAADAGTVIQMNSASSTTITVNTALFTAGDSVQIQNIGAGVCTITAGTATVTTSGSLALSQWEGGFLYFTSASASIFFDYTQTGAVSPLTTKGDIWGYSTLDARIPIGSNNQVLTADSTQALGLKWATPSTGSMTLLSTTTLSGASTTVSSIDQTYETLLVFIYGATWASGNGTVYIKPNNTANQCSFIGTYWQSAGAGTSGTSAGDIQSYLNTTNSSGLGFAAVNFYRYANTSQWKVYAGTGGNQASDGTGSAYAYGGTVKTTSALSSLNFYPSSGANFSGGTVLIYGVK